MFRISYYWERQKNGLYKRPISTFVCFWWVCLVLVTSIIFLMTKIISIYNLEYFLLISSFGTIALTLILTVKFFKLVKLNGSASKVLDAVKLEQIIQSKLLETRNLNRVKDVQKVRVPWVEVIFQGNKIHLEISKIAGLLEADIDEFVELINSSLIGKYKSFAVVSKRVSDDKLKFIFIIEDVASNLTWVPKNVSELKQVSYKLKFQEGLIVDLSKEPSVGIFGASGTGKSTVVFGLIGQLISTDSFLIFLDGKMEYSALSTFYPSNRFYSEVSEIIDVLKGIVTVEIPRRQRVYDAEQKKRKSFGLTGKDLGFSPLVIVADEIGNIPRTPKERKEIGTLLTTIMQRGRTISVFVIWATQDPSVSASMSVLGQGGFSQLSTRILLGSAKPEVQREVFGEVATQGDVPRFRGFYVTLEKKEPQRFFVPDLYQNNLMKIETFEELYKMRKKGSSQSKISNFMN